MNLKTHQITWCGPGSTWSWDAGPVLHWGEFSRRNCPDQRLDTSELKVQRWQRAKLCYSDADCGAFINRVSYTHHSACRGSTVENGRLASSDRLRKLRLHGTQITHVDAHSQTVKSFPGELADDFCKYNTYFSPHTCDANAWQLLTWYFKCLIYIIDAAIANYRPAQIGGKIIINIQSERWQKLVIIIIIFLCRFHILHCQFWDKLKATWSKSMWRVNYTVNYDPLGCKVKTIELQCNQNYKETLVEDLPAAFFYFRASQRVALPKRRRWREKEERGVDGGEAK